MKDKILIVGGGLAGLSAAAFLAKEGIPPLLLEKEEEVGGLVSSFERDGFSFDAGIRSLENQGILFPFLRNLGIDLKMIKTPVRIGFQNRFLPLDSEDPIGDYFHLLQDLFPQQSEDIRAIERDVKKICKYQGVTGEIDNPLLLEESELKTLKTLFRLLPWLVRQAWATKQLKKYQGTVSDFLKKRTDHQPLIDMIIQHFFTNTPAVFALSYFNMYQDYYYPEEGTGALPKALKDYILSKGGRILTKAQVVEVDPRAKRVQTQDMETYFYDQLIWAADQKTLYSSLRWEVRPEEKTELLELLELLENLEASKGTDSVLTLWLGTEVNQKALEKTVGPHGFYTPSLKGLSSLPSLKDLDFREEKAVKNWLNAYYERTTYEVSVPALRNPDLAPEGKSGLIISTLMDYSLVKSIQDQGHYEEFKEFSKEKILAVFGKLYPKLKDQVLFAQVGTPLTLERRTGAFQGAVSGWEFGPSMPSETSFQKMGQAIETPLPDIYQAGQWTFSPAGIPVSILTGKLAADELLKKRK